MKKRGLFAILLILSLILIVQNVKADVILTAVRSNTFNLGDSTALKGYVRAPATDTWTLTFNLQCDERITQLNKKIVSLTFDQRLDFDENIRMNDIGNCFFLIRFQSNSGVSEEAKSSNFLITKELKGEFLLDQHKVHFGDEIKLSGTIKRLDNTLVDGYGTLTIKKDNENYIVNPINIVNGQFTFKTSINALPQGTFSIDVQARDIYGNDHLFSNIDTFDVTNKLTLDLKLSKSEALPGDKIEILGNVLNANSKNIKGGEATIKVDFDEYKAVVIEGKVDYTYTIPKNINSNTHSMQITVTDEFQNTGETQLNFNIKPIITKLDVESNKDAYFPKDYISITPYLYDQADDQIINPVTLEIFSATKELAFTKVVDSNSETNFKLTDYATPGTWLIKVSSSALTDELNFEVKEVNDISTSLENQIVTVKNIGNVQYEENIEIIAEGSEKTFTFSRRSQIDPDESFNIYLYKELPDDIYDLTITNTKFKAADISIKDPRSVLDKFGDYMGAITGSFVKSTGSTTSLKPVLSLLGVIALIVVLVFIMRFSASKKGRRRREYEKQLGRETFGKIIKDKEKQLQKTEIKPRPTYRSGFGMRQESPEISDLRKKIDSDLNKHSISHDNDIEVRSTNNYASSKPEKTNGEKKGLFRMFD